ncbi:MAG: tyrosine-protein phosphatase [Planctomycetes bacterium]|nr:tyrosine-protein phosphatase [Planctomycetota bacterium]
MRSGPLLLCILFAGCGTTAADTRRIRPTQWAQPVLGSEVRNWHRVTPDLYRCAQPDGDDMRELAAFGIRSVVNLREHHSDADEVEGTGLVLIEHRLDAGDLTYAQLVQALRDVLQAPKPCVVHCWHGADRTGAVVAAYRIAVDGWTPAAALDEMVAGGFGHSVLYDNLRQLVGSIDPQRLRADVGLPAR